MAAKFSVGKRGLVGFENVLNHGAGSRNTSDFLTVVVLTNSVCILMRRNMKQACMCSRIVIYYLACRTSDETQRGHGQTDRKSYRSSIPARRHVRSADNHRRRENCRCPASRRQWAVRVVGSPVRVVPRQPRPLPPRDAAGGVDQTGPASRRHGSDLVGKQWHQGALRQRTGARSAFLLAPCLFIDCAPRQVSGGGLGFNVCPSCNC
jgi:hypothetical protein